jgi:hypothetical protein
MGIFFMDDFVSLTNYPNLPEAGTGLVDFIQVTTPAAPVPGPIAGAGLPGLILASGGPSRLVATAAEDWLSFRRKEVRCGLRSLSYCRPTLMSFPRAPTQNPSLVA